MWKKLVITISCMALLAVAVAGTVAFTDQLNIEEAPQDVFVSGDVAVTLDAEMVAGKKLMQPGVAAEKKITITNTGENAAWVWYTYEVDGKYQDYVQISPAQSENTSVNGTTCLYTAKLPAGGKVEFILKASLAEKLDRDDDDFFLVDAGVVTQIDEPTVSLAEVDVPIKAYAIQDNAFGDVSAAYAAFQTQ